MTGRFSVLGTTAALFEAGGPATLATQQRIWAMAQTADTWPELRESVPGMNNLMLVFNRPPADLAAFEARVLECWAASVPLTLAGRVVELPVVYGGEAGPHLADVVAHTGLGVDEIVERHTAPLYPVFALGSHPGYCYLGGMDDRIATPRRKTPVLRIPGGAVSIGGAQTGVSASDGPSGWNTIGHTDIAFFDPARAPPVLLQPGDSIRFRAERGGPMIELLATPGLATVQDLGRHGSLRYGVGTAGAMDRLALAVANLLLGNDEGDAAIEVPIFPFTIRFTTACRFALTGADCAARLAGQELLPWSAHAARAGDELTLGLPQDRACRAYLALPGGVDVPSVLGSRSTQIRGAFGGLEGRPLRAGDVLRAVDRHEAPTGFGLMPPSLAMPFDIDGVPAMRVLPAAEYDCLTADSRAAFWAETWKITPQSDRYGYRLAGETLAFSQPQEMLSHGIVPGVIQVPPGGQPIVQMSDAQPSGGYPKFGTVIEADLWRLGQAPVGSRVRFVETDWSGALAAREATEAWLSEARRMITLWWHQ